MLSNVSSISTSPWASSGTLPSVNGVMIERTRKTRAILAIHGVNASVVDFDGRFLLLPTLSAKVAELPVFATLNDISVSNASNLLDDPDGDGVCTAECGSQPPVPVDSPGSRHEWSTA